MCGICGNISKTPLTPEDVAQVAQLNRQLAHRGPDGEGHFNDQHLSFAMRRLSIIDLEGGWQPIYNEDRSLAIVANGEIYNYVELRPELEKRGHRFNTNSDIENILHLYEEHGLDFVQHLRGMFAFALWDAKRRRVVLARDRMGEKPLYLHERDGEIYFASELKALLQTGLVPLELDPVAVNNYFHYQYVPEPATPVKGIRKLPAGHLLVIDIDPWQVEQHCYWRMEDAEPLEGDPVELIRAELERVSEIVIRSDVPVGVALSGGLDSSAVAAMASAKYPGTMEAFSVGYPGRPEHDERNDAQALTEHLGIPFHDIELHQDEMLACFEELVGWRDDPIADISGYGYYAVNKIARQHNVPVLLQGQGGDELFWGYDWVRQALRESTQKLASSQPGLGNFMQSLELFLPKSLNRQGLGPWGEQLGGLLPSWQRYRRRTTNPDQLIFYDLAKDFARAERRVSSIYAPAFQEALNGGSPYDIFTVKQPWSDPAVLLTKLISQTYLLEDGVAQGDRLSMANSVELRLPLLDYRFVETVIGLRKAQPDYHLPPKHWLKQAMQGVLPDWALNRPKRGFEPPVRQWHAAIFEKHGDALRDGLLVQQQVLNPDSAAKLATGVYPKRAITPMSFKALVLELWARQMTA
ncbi:MAG: asparagine synthase (glutamine-hydrolyzing) [Chloroflexi bacterium]|nr:MAG: asparagine synthase (glutamine-hydrolyzing) [Chloroflexota bacterium]MBL1193169.1 asparagine synthase (glutamine-hydrolyzing) [Chloroflexota bacterium]NOH10462.1 asparagine synthase (glutamine-hydrolyzing) [Chloroflexota bacterium]